MNKNFTISVRMISRVFFALMLMTTSVAAIYFHSEYVNEKKCKSAYRAELIKSEEYVNELEERNAELEQYAPMKVVQESSYKGNLEPIR